MADTISFSKLLDLSSSKLERIWRFLPEVFWLLLQFFYLRNDGSSADLHFLPKLSSGAPFPFFQDKEMTEWMEIFSRHVHEQPKIKLIMTITNYSNIIGAFTAFFFFFLAWFRPNWTPLGPITITYMYNTKKLPLRKKLFLHYVFKNFEGEADF